AEAGAFTLELVATQAKRALSIPVGAALVARESVLEAARPFTKRTSAKRELNKFERRGERAGSRVQRELKRRVSRELRQRRTQATRLVKRNRREAERQVKAVRRDVERQVGEVQHNVGQVLPY
ncbi:MAG: hypothetical protein LC777_07350, partial [Actinobacteria bacterium]|nr:hypothetical protein [Actinomycetota bacterium]